MSKLDVLQHALGVDEFGRGKQYRAYYVAGPGHHSYDVCRELAADGLMKEYPASELSGGSPTFIVTDAGRTWMTANSPPPPKLTRSQRRYEQFLDADCDMRFGEWLKAGGWQEHRA